MSDSVGSFVQQLTRPEVVNPLAAVQAGNQAANTYWTVQQQRAVNALGDAYRSAINDKGEFDPNTFRANAAANAMTNMAIGAGLKNVQEISSDQLNQNIKKYQFLQDRSYALMQKAQRGEPITDEDISGALHDGVSSGILTLPEAGRAATVLGGANQQQRYDHARQIYESTQTPDQRYEQVYGPAPVPVGAGGETVIVNPQRRGTPPGTATHVPHSLSPEASSQFQTFSAPVDKNGNITTDENGNPKVIPGKTVGWAEKAMPRGAMGGAPLPGTPGTAPYVTAPGSATPQPNAPAGAPVPGSVFPQVPGGVPAGRVRPPAGSPLRNPNAAPPAAAPGSGAVPAPAAPATPAPAPSGASNAAPPPGTASAAPSVIPSNVAAITQGMEQARQGGALPGTQVAGPPEAAANVAPRSTVPGVTMLPGGVPMISKGPPQGQTEMLTANRDAYLGDQARYPDTVTAAQNLGHAYEALSLLNSSTGKGAEGVSALRSFAVAMGFANAATAKEQELFELVRKYTERNMIDAAGGASTDLGRRMQEAANAGTLLTDQTNFTILRNDLGKRLQSMAAYSLYKNQQGDESGGAGYLGHRADIAAKTDYRAFVWPMYSKEEKAQIQAQLAKDPKAQARFDRAYGMALDPDLNLSIPGFTMAPPPKK